MPCFLACAGMVRIPKCASTATPRSLPETALKHVGDQGRKCGCRDIPPLLACFWVGNIPAGASRQGKCEQEQVGGVASMLPLQGRHVLTSMGLGSAPRLAVRVQFVENLKGVESPMVATEQGKVAKLGCTCRGNVLTLLSWE